MDTRGIAALPAAGCVGALDDRSSYLSQVPKPENRNPVGPRRVSAQRWVQHLDPDKAHGVHPTRQIMQCCGS